VLLLAQKMRDEADERGHEARLRARRRKSAEAAEAAGPDSASECGSDDDWTPAERDASGLHALSWWSCSR